MHSCEEERTRSTLTNSRECQLCQCHIYLIYSALTVSAITGVERGGVKCRRAD